MKRYDRYSKYEDRWITSLPSHWGYKRLKEVLKERKEKNSPVKTHNILSLTNTRGVIPYSEKGNVGNKAKESLEGYMLAYPNDIVINSMNIIIGSVGLSKYFGAVSPVYYMLYTRNNDNIRYFNYVFQNKPFQESLRGLGNGILEIRMRIPMYKLNNVCIPVPPRSEQDQIVRYLDWQVSKTNKLISAQKKQIALLKEQKQAVINEVVTKGLDPAVPMKDSGVEWIGEIPAHWSIVKLRSILKPVSVKNRPELPLLSVVRELGVIVRDIEDVESNHNFIPDDLSNYKVVQEGQFAMNKMKAWQGSYGISPYTGIVSPAYFVFDVNFPNKNYFHYAIRSKVYVNFFAKSSDGIRVGQWDLNMQKMKEIPFILPPASEQDEIVAYIPKANAKIEKAIDAISQEIALLKEYRTRLISDVVTGQIDVRDIEVPEFEYIADDVDDVSDDENTDLEEIMEEEE